MLTLLRKDLVVTWKAILIIEGLWIIEWLTVLRLEGMLSVSACATAILPILAFGIDDNGNGDALICSLPVRRRDIVRTRYVLAFLLCLAGLGMTWIVSALAQVLAPQVAVAHGIELTGVQAGGFVVIVVIFTSVTMPFLFRSGFRRGILECGAVLAGILVVLSIIEYVISLRLGYAMFRVKPFAGIVGFIRDGVQSLGIGGPLTVVTVLIGLWTLSMTSSTLFYESRDL